MSIVRRGDVAAIRGPRGGPGPRGTRSGAALALALAVLSGPALADPCDGVVALGPVTVEAMPVTEILHERAEPSALQLRARTLATYLGEGWHANGLATARLRFASTLGLEGRDDPGGACYGLSSLDVSFGFPEGIDVHVTDRYPPGTCAHDAVLAHEERHVGIYAGAVNGHVGSVRTFVEGYLRARLPVRAPTGDRARDGVRALVGEAVDAMTKVIARGIEARNAEIDSPASYEAVRASCPSW